jgi:hypothetical protein
LQEQAGWKPAPLHSALKFDFIGLRNFLWLLALMLAAIAASTTVPAAPTNVYFTQFERSQGYTNNTDLVGSGGWLRSGSGGNGIVTNFFPGQGQQAYVGFSAPDPGDDQLVVWRPINYNPIAAGRPLVKFSVQMTVADSSNTNYDNFRWSVYNTQGNRLFALDFDNYYTDVSYLLDGTNPLVPTGVNFTPGSNYTLNVTMNFASNRWSATLGSALIATNQPITTVAAPLNLGDIDAVWLVYATNAPGNNYLLFDNYQITADTLSAPVVPPAQMQLLGRNGTGAMLRVAGAVNSRWVVEGSTNLVNWTALRTNTITGSFFDYTDPAGATMPRRFYRTRFLP